MSDGYGKSVLNELRPLLSDVLADAEPIAASIDCDPARSGSARSAGRFSYDDQLTLCQKRRNAPNSAAPRHVNRR